MALLPAGDPSMQAIHVIGVSAQVDPDSIDTSAASQNYLALSEAALNALRDATLIVGSVRQLELVTSIVGSTKSDAECVKLPKLTELSSLLDEHAQERVVLLASGDPLYYGIGRWLSEYFPHREILFYPAVSSIQLACNRSGLSMQDVHVVSLHGRPVESIRTQLHRNRDLLVLTDGDSQPLRLAAECMAVGLELTILTVFEKLGYADERIRSFDVKTLIDSASTTRFDPLNVVLLRLSGMPDHPGRYLPSFPGIADHLFITGAEPGRGMISKREVRLIILSYLAPEDNDVIWDIGAGCGSVAVELGYWNPRVSVLAIEHHPQRLECLEQNRQRFGVVKNLSIVAGHAPEALSELLRPDKVFIGGSDGQLETLLKIVWQDLPVGGRLVASAVTDTTNGILSDFACSLKTGRFECTELAVKRGTLAGENIGYQGKLPVTVFCFVKTRLEEVANK